MIEELRNCRPDRCDLEQLMTLLANATFMQTSYVDSKLTVPGWLSRQLVALRLEIDVRRRGDLQRQLTLMQSRKISLQEALKSPEQKLAEMDDEIRRLEAQLTPQPEGLTQKESAHT